MEMFECPCCNERIGIPESFARADRPMSKLNPTHEERIADYICRMFEAQTPMGLLEMYCSTEEERNELRDISTLLSVSKIITGCANGAIDLLRQAELNKTMKGVTVNEQR